MKTPEDFIAELEARLARLEQAARPIAEETKRYDERLANGEGAFAGNQLRFNLDDFRALAAALDEKREP